MIRICTVGIGAIVGRAGDVGFGVGLLLGTTVVVAAVIPFATVISPLSSAIDDLSRSFIS